jgi:peptidoglycan/xylan/chitin deacetylase (PgdA/CDA1 family)
MASPVILAYHAIDDGQANTSVSPAAFRRQMRWLGDRGYECLTVSDLLARAPRQKSVALTFDDGFRSVYRTALPVLRELGFVATCFPIEEGIGKRTAWRTGPARFMSYELMSETELSELAAEGWEIGSHTSRHECCVSRTAADLHTDVWRARSRLQDRFGVPVPGFAYPQGCHDAGAEDIVAEAGHTWAVATSPGTLRRSFEPYALRRVTVGHSTTFDRFLTATVEPIQAGRRAYYAISQRLYRPHVHPGGILTTEFI